MQDRPYLFIGILLVVMAIAALVASLIGSGDFSRSSSTSNGTFRAKPGTQRESAKALVNEGREYGDSGKPGTSTSEVEVWGRFESSSGAGESAGDAGERVEDILEYKPAAQAITELEAEIARSEAPSELYAALGLLYAIEEGSDSERAESAFLLALSTARDDAEVLEAAYFQMKVYLAQEEYQVILDLLDRVQPDTSPFEARALEVEIMRANAQAGTGDSEKAVETLKQILDRRDAGEMEPESSVENVFRQAGLRLMRLYRSLGRDDEAEKVAVSLKAKLRN